MKYGKYCIEEADNCIIVDGVSDFDPKHIFECGQCFRWIRENDGTYTGVVRGKVANVSYSNGRLVIDNATIDDFKNIWFDYFDLGRDYGEIKKAVDVDEIMHEAVAFGSGIRILRQEPWETLISFIISSNNRIPRIMKIIEDMSRYYGREIKYRQKSYYSFPDVKSLAACSLEDINRCRAGYRCGYIHKTAADIAEGRIDLDKTKDLDTDKARKYLLQLCGVGNKVADCYLLFSGTKYDVFPIDVWVKRVMEELYFKREADFSEIQKLARDKFGRYAGIAQQYLFYYAREQKIGI